MQDHRSHGRHRERLDCHVRKDATTVEQDAAIELAVIVLILTRHPAQLTIVELVRELAAEPDDFRQADAIQRAVRDLDGVGLLNRNGDFLVPSQAAIRLASLVEL